MRLFKYYPFGFTCSECKEVIQFCLQCDTPLCICINYRGGYLPYEIWCLDCGA